MEEKNKILNEQTEDNTDNKNNTNSTNSTIEESVIKQEEKNPSHLQYMPQSGENKPTDNSDVLGTASTERQVSNLEQIKVINPYKNLGLNIGASLEQNMEPNTGTSPYQDIGQNVGTSPYQSMGQSTGTNPYQNMGQSTGTNPYQSMGQNAGASSYQNMGQNMGMSPYQNMGLNAGMSPYQNMGQNTGTTPYQNMGQNTGMSPYQNMGPNAGMSPYQNMGPNAGMSPYQNMGPNTGINPYQNVGPNTGASSFQNMNQQVDGSQTPNANISQNQIYQPTYDYSQSNLKFKSGIQEQEEDNKNKKVGLAAMLALPILVLLISVVAIVGVNLGNKDFRDQMKLAREYYEAADYASAIDAYNKAMEINPDKIDVYLSLADSYIAEGNEYIEAKDYQRAIDDFQRAEQVLDDAYDVKHSYLDKSQISNKRYEASAGIREAESCLDEYLYGYDDYDDYDDYFDGFYDFSSNISDYSKKNEVLNNGGDYYEALPVYPWQFSYNSEPYGGVIIVGDGYNYGAIDYDGNELVPMDYEAPSTIMPATEDGYFVLKKDQHYSLFNNAGECIFTADAPICATKDYFIVMDLLDVEYDSSFGGWYCKSYKLDYYTYKDQRIVTTVVRDRYDDYVYGFTPTLNEDGSLFLYQVEDVTQEYDVNQEETRIVQELTEDYKKQGYSDDEIQLVVKVNYIVKEKYGSLNAEEEVGWQYGMDEPLVAYTISGKVGSEWVQDDIVPAKYSFISNFQDGYAVQVKGGLGQYQTANSDGSLYAMAIRLVSDKGTVIYSGDVSQLLFVDNKLAPMEDDWYSSGYDMDYVYKVSGKYLNGCRTLNSGTKVVFQTVKDRYLLVDLAKVDNQNCPSIIVIHDYLEMSFCEKLLVSENDKWGHADHNGDIIGLYQDVSAYAGEYAGLIEDDMGYIVDKDMNKLVCIGPTSRTWAEGELIGFQTDYGNMLYLYKE